MPKMSELELRSLLTAQRWDSMSAITASKLSEERATSLDYYQGDMSKDMPAPDGRSKAVSMDTSDTIEGMMPTLMDIFAGGDEVMRFEPIGPQDVAAAEQETDYVNHVFMQSNQGFLILYAFIKDALLSKNGIVKVYWEKEETKERETYLDQPPEALAALLSTPEVEVVEHTEHDGLHDVTIEAARVSEKARVVSVPPEEFGISRHARQIRDATYCFHDVFRSESQLIEQGFDEDQIKKLPSYLVAHTVEEIARDTVNESTLRQGEDNLNTANRLTAALPISCSTAADSCGSPGTARRWTQPRSPCWPHSRRDRQARSLASRCEDRAGKGRDRRARRRAAGAGLHRGTPDRCHRARALAAPFLIYLWKLVLWDKIITAGAGSTDDLSNNLWYVAMVIVGFYFLHWTVGRFTGK